MLHNVEKLLADDIVTTYRLQHHVDVVSLSYKYRLFYFNVSRSIGFTPVLIAVVGSFSSIICNHVLTYLIVLVMSKYHKCTRIPSWGLNATPALTSSIFLFYSSFITSPSPSSMKTIHHVPCSSTCIYK